MLKELMELAQGERELTTEAARIEGEFLLLEQHLNEARQHVARLRQEGDRATATKNMRIVRSMERRFAATRSNFNEMRAAWDAKRSRPDAQVMLGVARLINRIPRLVALLAPLLTPLLVPLLLVVIGAIRQRGKPLGTQRALQRVESAFQLAELLVPRRICREELGDAMEVVQEILRDGRPIWHAYVKAVTTILWLVWNAVRAPASTTKRKGSRE
jgi:hypothetical protein